MSGPNGGGPNGRPAATGPNGGGSATTGGGPAATDGGPAAAPAANGPNRGPTAAPAATGPNGGPAPAPARPRPRPVARSIGHVGLALTIAFGGLAAGAGYWQVVRSPDLSVAPDNPIVIAAARSVVRGEILDRHGTVLATNARDANGEPYRIYPEAGVSTVIGYASRRYGTAGLERSFNAALTGVSDGDPIQDILRKFQADLYDPQALSLSLSLPLQRAALEGLGDDRGAVVILDPRSGEVLVLASNPGYDAGAIANPATEDAGFAAANDSDARPLLTRATQGEYVPGSVFKIVTAIAGLGSGAIEADTTFPQQAEAERDGLVVNGFRIREHGGVPVRTFDIVEATEVSSNIFYALAGLETGGDNLRSFAERMGFHEPLPFDLPTGISQVTNGDGAGPGGFDDDVELANAAYGQGETLATPLQMALVASAVANDGLLMRPRLVWGLTGRDGTRRLSPETIDRVIDAGDAATITAAMREAVEGDLGRQFTSGAAIDGVPTAGKSGTAELGGTGAPHSWFIGFAPADNPVIAIAVLVERGGRGGERAAPLAGRLMAAALAEKR